MSKHTPTPWFADDEGRIWRRPPNELHENGGPVAGDKPLAATSRGWYGEDDSPYPMHENAEFICHAVNCHAELLEACKMLLTLALPFDASGQSMVGAARAAIRKATRTAPDSAPAVTPPSP